MNEQAQRALSEALRLAEHGYRLTPVTITRGPNGKKQARFHKGWRHEDAWSNDREQIRAWWVDHPDTSFAIGGAANGIEGVDLDYHPDQGVDGTAWWGTQGLPMSPLTQVTPSNGLHLIWRANPDRGLPQEAGKTFGRGVDTRNRAGLFFAAGSYVVGEPGHYEVSGALPKLADLPTTPPVVLDHFAGHGRTAAPDRPVDGRIVYHDDDWQQAKVAEALAAIREHDRNAGGYRAKLMGAGLLLGRAVEQGFLSRERAEGIVLDAHRSVWGDAVWPENVADVRAALADGPRLERWRVPELRPSGQLETIGPADERGPEPAQPEPGRVQESVTRSEQSARVPDGGTWDVAPGEAGYDPDAKAAEARLRLDAKAIEDEARKRMARRVVSASEREPIRVLTGLAFLSAPTPEYLVPDMLFVDSTAKMYGPPGGTKSYFALDLVMHMVAGLPWRGKRLGRHKVHYVMAEGQAVNTVRALGWLHHHVPDLDHAEIDSWLTVVPQGVLLTPEGVADYLVQVERDRPALVVLDTKNAMMDGNENDAGDVAVMVRAMRAIRDAAAGACVLLVDHTGLADESRGRGSNAVTAAMDTEIRVGLEGTIATAEVTRNKAAIPGASWTYRLQSVRDVPGLRPGTPDPAVCVPATHGDATDPFEVSVAQWWQHDMDNPVPEVVSLLTGPGSNEARDIFRVLRYAQDDMSMAALLRAINEKPRERKCSEATARRGRIALEGAGVVIAMPGPKYGLSPEYLSVPPSNARQNTVMTGP